MPRAPGGCQGLRVLVNMFWGGGGVSEGLGWLGVVRGTGGGTCERRDHGLLVKRWTYRTQHGEFSYIQDVFDRGLVWVRRRLPQQGRALRHGRHYTGRMKSDL